MSLTRTADGIGSELRTRVAALFSLRPHARPTASGETADHLVFPDQTDGWGRLGLLDERIEAACLCWYGPRVWRRMVETDAGHADAIRRKMADTLRAAGLGRR